MTPLLVLLGAALCCLTMSMKVVPQADFNLQAAGGKWYLIGFATNSQRFVNISVTMKMGVATLVPTAEGDVDLSYARVNDDGSCWRRSYRANKTDTPGKFAFVSKRQGNENYIIMVDVKYDDYALVYNIKKQQEEDIEVIRLYGRRDEVSAEVKEKFRRLALDAGTRTENIAFLPKNAQCPPA